MTRMLYTKAMLDRSGLSPDDARALAHSIRWCVDRLLVSTSQNQVLRHTCARLRLAAKRRQKPLVLTREARKFVYRVALRAHAANVLIYRRFVLRRA